MILFSFSSCIDKEKKYINKTISKLNNIPLFSTSKYNYVIIIPGAGCSGCISEAESFFLENKNDSIFFVFTKTNSIKHLKLRIGESIKKNNMHIDHDNIFLHYDINKNLYPLIFNLKDKNNIKYDYLNPGYNIALE